MNDLRTLHDAFDALERRADTAPVHDLVTAPRRRTKHLAAPVAAAAAVVLAAGTVALWQHHDDRSPSTAPAGGGRTVPSVMPSAPHVATPHTATGYQPPTTEAQLTAKARDLLAGVATIVVTDGSDPGGASGPTPSYTPNPQAHKGKRRGAPAQPITSSAPDASSGAGIVGTLTADGVTGGFDLDVYASPGGRAMCDADTSCSVHTRADGSTVAIGSWHDQQAPGGVTYQVEMVRPDGADVLMHLSTEHDPKGESAVTASHLPLTVKQMVDFVTSPSW